MSGCTASGRPSSWHAISADDTGRCNGSSRWVAGRGRDTHAHVPLTEGVEAVAVATTMAAVGREHRWDELTLAAQPQCVLCDQQERESE